MRQLIPLLFVPAILLTAQTTTMLENDQVRVLKAVDQPHKKTAPHEHKLNRVLVYLNAGRQEITPQGGKTAVSDLKAGQVKWSPASGVHVSENMSGTPLEIVEVEIKKPGDPGKSATAALDPVKIASKSYKVEFENPQVRVVRVRIGPHESVPQHEHVLNRVVVYLTDQSTRITSADGKVETAEHKAGEASWGGPAKHQEQNISAKPFEAVVVELKD